MEPARAELVLFSGLQGSGKTTFYQRRFAATHVHVSRDLLRNNSNPARREAFLVDAALARGASVVVDNTHPSADTRAPLVSLGKRHGAVLTAYFFVPDIAQSLRRNALRVGKAKVPEVAIYATMKRLRAPTWEEGFDGLFEVVTTPDDFVVRALPR